MLDAVPSLPPSIYMKKREWPNLVTLLSVYSAENYFCFLP